MPGTTTTTSKSHGPRTSAQRSPPVSRRPGRPRLGEGKSGADNAKDQRRAEAESRAASKRLRNEVGLLEKRVSELEAKQGELTAALEAPETYQEPGRAQQLNRELSAVVDQLQEATADWEKAATRLTELEK